MFTHFQGKVETRKNHTRVACFSFKCLHKHLQRLGKNNQALTNSVMLLDYTVPHCSCAHFKAPKKNLKMWHCFVTFNPYIVIFWNIFTAMKASSIFQYDNHLLNLYAFHNISSNTLQTAHFYIISAPKPTFIPIFQHKTMIN